mgnify:CR=1 FL=1
MLTIAFNPYNGSKSTITAALVDHVMVGNTIEYYDGSSNLMAAVSIEYKP